MRLLGPFLLLRLCQTAESYFLPAPATRTLIGRSLHSLPPVAFTKPKPIPLPVEYRNMVSSDTADDGSKDGNSLRDRLRQVTGFSFTALRTTLRGITGISLTALYASAVATTSSFVRNTMKLVLSIFPSWFRYFLQPFLILYYVPLFVIRANLAPSVKDRKAGHEHLIDGWKQAVEAAEKAQEGGYWPVHVNEEGSIVAVLPPDPDADESVDIADAVAESVEATIYDEDKSDK